MSTPAPAQLRLIWFAVDHLMNFEGQDRALVVDMSQAMLYDVIDGSGLAPLADYIRRYCDVIDGPADADRIAAEIEAEAS